MLEHETAQQVKIVLCDDSDPGVSDLRARLDELFGGGPGWLDESDRRLEQNLGTWLTDAEAAQLTVLATDVRELVPWFDELLGRWSGGGQQPDHVAEAEPRFTHVDAVEGYPDWWQGFDTAEPDVDGGYKYVRATEQPTDQTPGWMSRTEAFALMRSMQPAEAPAEEEGVIETVISDIVLASVDGVARAEELTPEEIEQALDAAVSELT